MPAKSKVMVGLATGIGALALGVTSGTVVLANHFLEELTRPHEVIDSEEFNLVLPVAGAEPPASLKRLVFFSSKDGAQLCGEFWAQPHAAPTIILCHGFRISRNHMRPVAALQYEFGYNVLLFDFRGHGESDSIATTGGNAEVRDLEAALVVARQQQETLPGKLIIHGFSMGAATALLLPPQPDVAGIIADSPYARLDEILRRMVRQYLTLGSIEWKPFFHKARNLFPVIAWATVKASTFVFRVRFGHALLACPANSFRRWRSSHSLKHFPLAKYTPILLIHAEDDDLIPITHARELAQQARDQHIPIDTYFVPEGNHCGAYKSNPQQYIATLQKFLTHHLGTQSAA